MNAVIWVLGSYVGFMLRVLDPVSRLDHAEDNSKPFDSLDAPSPAPSKTFHRVPL